MKNLTKLSAAVVAAVMMASASQVYAAEQIDVQAALAAAKQAQAAAEAAQAAALKAQAAAEAAQAKAEAQAARAQALADASATSASSAEAAAQAAAQSPAEPAQTAQVGWKPSVDFHGYFRSGIGKSRNDGAAGGFNIGKVGRLGNENDTYGEIELGSEVYRTADGVSFYVDSMLHVKTYEQKDGENLDDGDNEIALRQFNLQVRGLIPGQEDAVIWAGKRYYQRQDIHIIDCKYLNISGPGAGVEYLDLGPGKFSAAWVRMDSNGVDYRYDDGYKEEFGLQTTNIDYADLRYSSDLWAGGWGELAVAVAIPSDPDVTRHDQVVDGEPVFDNGTSVMITAQVSQSFDGGYNKTVLQYMTGGLAHNAIDIGGGWYDSWNEAEDAWGVSLINTGEWQLTDNFSFTHVLHYGYAKDLGGDLSGDYEDWRAEGYPDTGRPTDIWAHTGLDTHQIISAVARTSLQLSSYVRWLNEVGFYIEDCEYDSDAKAHGYDDYIERGQKYTTAIAIAPEKAILSRPELRFYATYMHASDDTNRVSNAQRTATYGDNWVFGVQAEAWW